MADDSTRPRRRFRADAPIPAGDDGRTVRIATSGGPLAGQIGEVPGRAPGAEPLSAEASAISDARAAGARAHAEAEAADIEQATRHESEFKRTLREARDFKALRASRYGLLPALVFALLSLFQRLDSAAFSLAAPEIARDLEINAGDIISVLVLVGTFSIFAAIGAGYLADRTRRVPFLGLGALLSGIASVTSAGATSFASLAFPRVVGQVSEQAADVPKYSLLADYYPVEVRGKAFALLGTLGSFGQLIVPLVGGVIIVTLGWRWVFIIAGIPLAISGLVAFLLLFRREPVRGYFERTALGASEEVALKENEPLSFGEGWRATWGVRTIRRIVIASIFGGAASAITGLFYVFFLAEKYGLNGLQRGLVHLPVVIAGLAGGFIGGGLVDRFTRSNPSRVIVILGVFNLLLAFSPIMYVFEPPLWVLIVSSVPFGFGVSMVGPASGVVFSQVIPPSIRTQGLQVIGLAALPTTILFFPLARQIFSLYGYGETFMFTVPLALIGGILWMTAAPFYELDMRSASAAAMADEEWRRTKESGRAKLLVCRGIEVEYSGVQVLFGVDFDVEDGEIIALLGTNGAGKSTLLRAISGTQPASGGAVVFDGRDVTYAPPNEIVSRGVVLMPGGRGVFPEMSVRENLVLGGWLTVDPVEAREQMADVLSIFPALAGRLDVAAGSLSGGEQQQLSLAQAFLSRPRLLLIDELSLGLSPTAVAQILDSVRELHRRGITIVVVEQSVNVALTIATKAVFMEKGEVRFSGPTAELLERPDILRAVYVKGTGALTAAAPGAARARRQRIADLESGRVVLSVAGLTKRYGGVTAVDDVSFDLRDGETLGLIGPNGAGKTTIFDLISGYQVPDGGTVHLEGVDVTDWGPDARARAGLVRRFQDARMFPALTVEENLLMALEQHLDVRSPVLHALRVPRARRSEKRVRARAERLLELFELGSYRDKFVKELSTGLRRIVDLAAVLATEPKVLLLDEPSSGIAQAETESLGPLLRRVRYETGASILIIEHDMPLISRVSDELLALELGSVVTRGAPEDVLNNPRVIEAYLGTDEATVQRSGDARARSTKPSAMVAGTAAGDGGV